MGPAPAGPVDPFNCAIGAPMSWGAGKKTWCCVHHHIGCPTTPAPPAPVAPMIVRPPPPPPPMPATTSCPYDCNAGYSNWEKGWPAGKKDYCCKTAHRGCSPAAPPAPVVTTSLPYDCNAGYHNCYQCLLKQWSVGKLAWCCQHAGRGCPTTAAPR